MRATIRRLGTLTVIAATSGAPSMASAASGDLDPTFGGDGVVHTNLSSERGGRDTAFGLAIQADGSIVVVGRAGPRFGVARFADDGTLDDGFGQGGKVRTDVGPGPDMASDVALQSTGRIVVAGTSTGPGGGFAVVRYRPNGSLDRSFGDHGVVLTPFSGPDEGAMGVAIDAEDRIVVVGHAGGAFVTARYDTDGRLDDSFSADGVARTNLTKRSDVAAAVAIQADGAIVVVGTARFESGGASQRWAEVRYEESGRLDDTFDLDGVRIEGPSSYGNVAYDVAIGNDGQILVVGTVGVGGFDTDTRSGVIQLDPSGQLDISFSTEDTRSLNVTNRPDTATSVVVQDDDDIVMAGVSAAGGPFLPEGSGCAVPTERGSRSHVQRRRRDHGTRRVADRERRRDPARWQHRDRREGGDALRDLRDPSALGRLTTRCSPSACGRARSPHPCTIA